MTSAMGGDFFAMAGIQYVHASQLINLPPSSARGEPAWRKKSSQRPMKDIFCEVALYLNSQ